MIIFLIGIHQWFTTLCWVEEKVYGMWAETSHVHQNWFTLTSQAWSHLEPRPYCWPFGPASGWRLRRRRERATSSCTRQSQSFKRSLDSESSSSSNYSSTHCSFPAQKKAFDGKQKSITCKPQSLRTNTGVETAKRSGNVSVCAPCTKAITLE